MITTRSRKILGALVVTAAAVAVATPAGAAPGTLYSPNPLDGWGQDGTAYAVDIVGGSVFVGGSFANAVRYTQSKPRANLMSLDRATGSVSAFVANTNGPVYAIASDGASLYIGGDFTTVGGKSATRLAKLDLATGAVDTGFGATSPKAVRDLLVVGNTLYVVGDFGTIKTTTRKYAAAVNKSTGAVLPFDPVMGGRTNAVAINPAGTKLYLGGSFTTVGGTARRFLAAVDPSSGALQGPAFAKVGDVILDLSATDTRVFGAGGGGFNSAAAWDTGSGKRKWADKANGDVQAIKYSNGNVYFGFHDGYNGDVNLRLLAADAGTGAVEPAFMPASGGYPGVLALDADGDFLASAGSFPKMGSVNVKGVSIHP